MRIQLALGALRSPSVGALFSYWPLEIVGTGKAFVHMKEREPGKLEEFLKGFKSLVGEPSELNRHLFRE